MKVIGITGSLGSGKGTVVSYLKKKGFRHYSVRSYITEEIKRRKLPVNRESMVEVANDLRAKHSPSYIIEKIYEKAIKEGKNCVIESIRTPGEAEWLGKNKDFTLVAVDAPQEIRYERIKKRKLSTDLVTFDEFKEQEKKEMSNEDKNKQNISKCMESAEYKLINNASKKELYKQVEQILKGMRK